MITGLVDWENARAVGLPDADLLHWWLSTEPGELGATVRRVLLDPPAAEARVAGLPQLLINHEIAIEHLVLLTWLWHVSRRPAPGQPQRGRSGLAGPQRQAGARRLRRGSGVSTDTIEAPGVVLAGDRISH